MAGGTVPYLVLTNTGPTACELQGWPGVSFVGDGNGTQLGAAATMDRFSPHAAITVPPKGSAHVPLRISDAEDYAKAHCRPAKADGLRVYAPGETRSIFVRTKGLTACRNKDVQLLEVQGIEPGAS